MAVVPWPFAALNLRCNPFGEAPARERAALVVTRAMELDTIARRLSGPGFALQLIGAMGRGKSSHLSLIHDRYFPGEPVTYLAEDEPPPPIPAARVVFVDESQRLSRRARRRLFRRRASFVLATHEDHSGELRASGVEVLTHAVGGLDRAHLRRIVQRRLEWARRGPGPLPEVPDEVLRELILEHGDDLRSIEDDLYFWFQRLRDRVWRTAI